MCPSSRPIGQRVGIFDDAAASCRLKFVAYARCNTLVLPQCFMQLELLISIADSAPDPHTDEDTTLYEDRLWRDDGWTTARVIKNEDDDGWAVEMIKDGEAEPALTGPWTMGRDKKNPKPLDSNAFCMLVKTASEVLRRHEQQGYAMLHKGFTVRADSEDVTVSLDIVPDEGDPYADLKALDSFGALACPRAGVRGIQAQQDQRAGLGGQRLSQARLIKDRFNKRRLRLPAGV